MNIAVNVDEDVADDGQSWAAYASSTDNTTGDGWVSIAARDYGDDELDFIGFSHKQAKRGDK